MTAPDTVEYGTCTRCGYAMFPVPPLSPCGHDAPVELKPLVESGRVYSWTRVHLGEEPQLIVMADFLGGRLRVNAPMKGTEEVSIGDEVRLEADETYPYRLVPV